MVYTGHPSKGCLTCRARRIKVRLSTALFFLHTRISPYFGGKCDEAKPVCNKCIKSKRICKGYRDEFDLIHRSETKSTARKAQARVAREEHTTSSSSSSPASPSSTSSSSSSESSFPASRPDSRIAISKSNDARYLFDEMASPRALEQGMTQRAICFFMANFVIQPRHQEAAHGHFRHLGPMLASGSSKSHVALAVEAVGQAALANKRDRAGLMPLANVKYSDALRSLKRAIMDPVEARSDHTLMSVMLLAVFEMIVPSTKIRPAWGNHVDGAVALIEMRGPKQFETEVGRSLFFAVRWKMIINAMNKSIYSDEPVGHVIKNSTISSPTDRLAKTLVNVPVLRAALRETIGRPEDPPKPKTATRTQHVYEIIAQALDLDAEISKWPSAIPASWLPKTVATFDCDFESLNLDTSECFPGNIDDYLDIWIGAIWNMYRSARIFINFFILRCCTWLDRSPARFDTELFKNSRAIIQDIADDICASIPFYFGYGPSSPVPKRPRHTAGTEEDDEPAVLGGYLLCWPLSVLLIVGGLPPLQKRWVRGRLLHIGRVMGIAQAVAFSEGFHFKDVPAGGMISLANDQSESPPSVAHAQRVWEAHPKGGAEGLGSGIGTECWVPEQNSIPSSYLQDIPVD
ncbi:MAG: COPII subunit [Chaenotheca gracillima]|nr:MAG: COPII subunit [Chaenotheca gracillima]